MATELISDVANRYPDFLRDESRLSGHADSISFPCTEQEIRDHLRAAHAGGAPVTIQAGRTGITAGAVPFGGHILNLSRMNRITALRPLTQGEGFLLTVQPGVLLSELREAVAGLELSTEGWSTGSVKALEELRGQPAHWFPPDPTETSAALGGMVSCNASGARSFRYGATRNYVERLRVVRTDGATLELQRGKHKADGRSFAIEVNGGPTLKGQIPDYDMPHVKSAAGYFAAPDMDLIDLFIGAEGTLGVISEIDIRLVPAPAFEWGVTLFMPSEESALQVVKQIRGVAIPPVALEFFGSDVLQMLRDRKANNPTVGELPELNPGWHTALYLEFHGDSEESVETQVMAMIEIAVGCGGDESATWMASDAHEMERLKNFRHAVPEAVNLLIDERRKREPGLTKLGTDLAVPDEALDHIMSIYHSGLQKAGLESVIFGHIGDNHLHVNIIPRDLEEYERGRALYHEWAGEVIRLGGTVSAEHGIGKLKVALLREMVGEEGIRQMKALRSVFDPDGVLNPGNLF